MSLSLADFRRLLRKGLGNLDTGDLSDDDCDEILNISLWDIEDKFPFELKETLYSTSLVEGQIIYNLTGVSNLDSLHSVAIVDENSKRNKLARMTRAEYDINHIGAEESYGFPKKYMREGNALYLEPIPSLDEDGLSLEISIREGLASLAEGSQEVSGLPRNWDEIVLQGAIVRGHNLNQDYDLRDKALNYQVGMIRSAVTTEAKEEGDSRFAGLNVLWDRPE
jgi:hypothetical protein